MVEVLVLDAEVKAFGNGAHVILPKEFLGERVDVLRRGLAPHFAVEFRIPAEGGAVETASFLAQEASPQLGHGGYCNGVIVRGAYGPRPVEVRASLRRIAQLDRRDRAEMIVLKDGHTPVARVESAAPARGSLRQWASGYAFTVPAEAEEVFDQDGMSPKIREADWRRQIRE